MKTFLGMATYLSKFIPDFSEMSSPLRVLDKKGIEWHWENEQEEAFNKLKSAIANYPTLAFFNVNQAVKIQSDASQHGLGSVLL